MRDSYLGVGGESRNLRKAFWQISVDGLGFQHISKKTWISFKEENLCCEISGIFLGEALLPLEDIAVTDMNKNLADLPQLLLPLTKPSEHGKKKRARLYPDLYTLRNTVEPAYKVRFYPKKIGLITG